MDVFELRHQLVDDYASYIRSFISILDKRIEQKVEEELKNGFLWPEPLIQLNPSFAAGETIEELVAGKILHPDCREILSSPVADDNERKPLSLYHHQSEAVRIADSGVNYVLTTGTGSGKSLAYIIPIVNYVL